MRFSAKRVCYFVLGSGLLFQNIVISLQKLAPTHVSTIQLLLRVEMFQCFMARVDDEFIAQQIVPLIMKCLDYSIELQVIMISLAPGLGFATMKIPKLIRDDD